MWLHGISFLHFSPSVKKDEENEEVKDRKINKIEEKDTVQEVFTPADASVTSSTPLLASNKTIEKTDFPSNQYGSTAAPNDSLNTTKSDLNSSITGKFINILDLRRAEAYVESPYQKNQTSFFYLQTLRMTMKAL